MSYTSKKIKANSDLKQKIATAPTIGTFADERSSTATQFKQQQMMHSAQSPKVVQKKPAEEDEPLQGQFENKASAQLQDASAAKPNNTALPDNLKFGIENLSGYAMDDVKVHFNSDKPAQLNAHAYAQGTDIHVAPGQEQHLPHEAWHVVQQKQGRVQPTVQMKAGVPVNDDAGLENEADVMGAKALQLQHDVITQRKVEVTNSPTAQLNKTGIGVGALIGGGIGALGFLAGPVVGAITTTAGAAIGGMIGHHLTKPQEGTEAQDFGKFPANGNIDPDKLGEENNGIRMLEEAQTRPDDVPLMQDYRLAMHKLHNVILVLEKAARTPEKNQSPDTAKLREKMVSVQKKAKGHAKHYKAGMRDLTSNEQEDNLKETYINGMDELTRELTNHTLEGENVIKKHGYLHGKGSLEEEGTHLWRDQWLKTKRAVDIALISLWGGWKNSLKAVAKTNKGDKSANTAPNQQNWEQRINNENWDIFYGGSLMKGYKGPPKQNTRFLSSNFDVDANMDAPAVAEFLINEKGKKVDRGQLDPRGAGTRIEDMDDAMDTEVKKELVNGGLVPNVEAANKIVSEKFETRVNAPGKLGAAANEEVDRSSEEQRVRDKLTGVRKLDPNKMLTIGNNLHAIGLLKDGSLDARPLTKQEIIQVETIIDAA